MGKSVHVLVSIGGWLFGIQVQPDLAVIREPGGGHPAPLRELVGCFPNNIGPVKCPDPAPGFVLGFTCRPSDLITLFGVLSACRGFSVLFEQPLFAVFRLMCQCLVISVCCLFSPYRSRSCQIRGNLSQQVFSLMCLSLLRWVTQCAPDYTC